MWKSIQFVHSGAPLELPTSKHQFDKALKSVPNFSLSHNLPNFSKAFTCFKSRTCFKILMKRAEKLLYPFKVPEQFKFSPPLTVGPVHFAALESCCSYTIPPTFWNASCTDSIYQHSSKCLNTSKE